jgi:diguanylate cyclase (GGDEF)-like protein
MRVVTCLVTEHNLWLVGLAAAICIAGSAITFRLFSHMRNRSGRQIYGWSFLTAVAAGSSIWCTHFIAMLAYQVKAPVVFDPALTLASLVIAIAGCAIGFGIAGMRRSALAPIVGGAAVGLSVTAMHYTGMMAYHVAGIVAWSKIDIASSVVIATTLAALALDEAVRKPRKYSYVIAPALYVGAIVGLHFTGMTAFSVTPILTDITADNGPVFQVIAVAVAGVALMIIGTGVASYLIDEMASQENIAKLQHMALNDGLTGLPNRLHFNEHFSQELERARANGSMLAVIGIDLDRFKAVNDHHGHDAGDQILKLVSRAMIKLVEPGEFIARIGGDEFSAVKRYDKIEQVLDFVSRLENAMRQTHQFGGARITTGGSIGVALFPGDGEDTARLITNADLAMYRAKADIQRSVCFYENRMDEAARERSAIAAELNNAIAAEEFELHYQVQGCIPTGDITGYEVLLRWRHPMRGLVPPMEFIPIAEETGSIVEIGEWVLRTACREARAWPTPIKIAVNVSAIQIQQPNFAETVHAILVETGFSPSRLEIEITETTIVRDKVRALHTLRRLRAIGVTIAIDDFGIGYSSLETLRTFPFDKIKMDKSFVEGLTDSPQTMAIVRAVLALGKSLDIKVLAEGVETSGQLAALRGEGCHEAQGFYLGRPQRTPVNIITHTQPATGSPATRKQAPQIAQNSILRESA